MAFLRERARGCIREITQGTLTAEATGWCDPDGFSAALDHPVTEESR